MAMKDQLVRIADIYAAYAGIGRKRLSTLVFNRGAKLDDIAAGADIATGTYERALQWFSDRWPVELNWPLDVVRPLPSENEGAA